jgi:outer membrane protein assembly factor BamB
MNISKNKSKISTISLIILLTFSATLIALPSVAAQGTQVSYPFIGVVPNPVGINQVIVLHTGIFQQLSQVQMGWEDISISILRPDGQTDYITGIKTDSTGGTGRTYTPTLVGTYTIKTIFPEQALTAEKTAPGFPIGTVFLASESAPLELVVQQDPIEYYPGHPLPQEYWTRPIDAQLREWYQVTGNWLQAGSTAPVVLSDNLDAPDSAHILWTKPLTMGGVAGGDGEYWAFSHGDAYEGKWTNRLIINGILIYCHRTNERPLIYHAVDVHTGEEIWSKVIMDNRTIAFGQNLVWAGQNHHAVYPYFWVTIGSDWYAFDPLTGDWQFTIENIPSGTTVTDENGWLYRVNLNYNSGEGYIWSMVDFVEPFDDPTSSNTGSWLPAGSFYGYRYRTLDAAAVDEDGNLTREAARGYITEFTFQSDPRLRNTRAMAWGDKVFGLQYSTTEIITWAISLAPGHEGALLYHKTWNAPAYWDEGQVQIEFEAVSLDEGYAAFWVKDTLEHYFFSTDTGDYVSGPTTPEYYMNYYGWTELGERPNIIWDGKFYSSGAGGIVYCFDIADASTIWTYAAEDPYQEYLFANNWWQFFNWIVDGKLYSGHMEHSAIEPMPRGAPFLCLNATTGEEIWTASGLFRSTRWGGRAIMGDSIMVEMDTYDNRLYAVGKGPSAITVESTLMGVPQGRSVTVAGTVTDVSPGTKSENLKLRFPNGVPVAADESMSEWMLYVYKQFEKPMNTMGVDVRIQTINPAGEFAWIGTAQTDSFGKYSYSFIPQMEGIYTIIVTFLGTGSYYGATTETHISVDPAPAPYPTIPSYPGYQGPSAQDVANSVLASLPADATPQEVAQAVVNAMPEYPEPTVIPEYSTMELIITILVALAIVICIISFVVLNKKK